MSRPSSPMAWQRRLVLIRHGETLANREKRFQGHHDVPLSELGERQAVATADRIAREFDLVRCYSSDLARADETAREIAQRSAVDIHLDPALREANLGALQGQPWDRAAEFLGDESGYLDRLSLHAAPPDGETPMHVRRRCQRFVRSLFSSLDELDRGDLAVVAHGGSLRALLAVLLGLPAAGGWAFRFDNCSVTSVLIRPDRPALLLAYNDFSHLGGLAGAPARNPWRTEEPTTR
jgi:broad specificity phosphatase PhoE